MTTKLSEAIKRDELNLRAKHPDLRTKIYKVSEFRYEIWCDNIGERFDPISKEFDESIRMVTNPVKITKIKPLSFVEKISKIYDDNIPNKYRGLSMRTIDLYNLISLRFKSLDLINVIGNDGDMKIKIHFSHEIPNGIKPSLISFLNNICTIDYEIIENSKIEKHDLFENPSLYIYASKFNKVKINAIERDEEFWSNNVEGMYKNEISKSDLFFYNDKTKSSCYVNCSVQKNANLRNFLFLYDTVFLSLPIETPIRNFCMEQKLSQNELSQLIEKKRIKILLTQPIERYDMDFLEEIDAISEESIITRKAINSALVMDIASLKNNYFIDELDLTEEMWHLAIIMSKAFQMNTKDVYQMLSWPHQAYRSSFSYLDNGSPLKVTALGVSNPIQKILFNSTGKNLDLELMHCSTNIHIASALDAAYFPADEFGLYNERPLANLLSESLQIYKNSTINRINEFGKYKGNSENRNLVAPINMFEVNEFISITEFDKFILKNKLNTKGLSLLSYLNNLDKSMRNEKIREYNQSVQDAGGNRALKKGQLEFAGTLALDVLGLWIPFLGITMKAVEKLGKHSDIPKESMRKILNKLEVVKFSESMDSKNIKFLEKANPIVRLKRI